MPNFSGVWTLKQATDAKQANNWPGAPTDAPTIGTATAGDASASVTFTGISDPSVTSYRVTSSPGGITATGTTSPISVTGLTNGTAYTFTVAAGNSLGYGPESAASNSVTPAAPSSTGLIEGGAFQSTQYTFVDSLNISTLGNTTSFGNLVEGASYAASAASSTRALVFGGKITTSETTTNIILYITFATGGTGSDFGDLIQPIWTPAAGSNSTRALVYGGYTTNGINVIQYVTIATTGNSTDFGDMSRTSYGGGACGNSTRNVIQMGVTAPTNTLEYVTIATTGNSTDFGDLTGITTQSVYWGGACSNSTRGIFALGVVNGNNTNTINYITIATTGNSTDFGDLIYSRGYQIACASSSTRATFWGYGAAQANAIDYVTIDTTGNASDFGDLSRGSDRIGAYGCSNSHGGLS